MDPKTELAIRILKEHESRTAKIPTTRFVYEPLDHRRKEIRLLTIASTHTYAVFPIDGLGALQCTLEVVSLRDDPQHEAISYCWGDPDDRENITMNGSTVSITKSLSSALRQFRGDDEDRAPVRFWADAVCINQEDNVERAEQVAIMRDIYASATNVRIWLGPRWEYSEEVGSAFELLRIVGTEGMTLPKKMKWFVPHLLGLGKMFQNVYWSRRWITQEIALAKSLTIHDGPISRPLSVEGDIVNIRYFGQKVIHRYSEALSSFFPVFSGGPAREHDPQDASYDEWVAIFESTRTMLSAVTNIITARNLILRPGDSASVALHQLRGSKCSRNHDYVYGLLGMTNANDHGIIPDYDKPWQQVFADFTARVMIGDGNLGLMYYATPRSLEIPSWTLDWRFEVAYEDHPVAVENMYNASAGTPFALSIIRPGAIMLRGLMVDTVEVLGASAGKDPNYVLTDEEMYAAALAPARHRVLKDWIRLHDARSPHPPLVYGIHPDQLRTLLADEGQAGQVVVKGRLTRLPWRITSSNLVRYKRAMDHFLNTGEITHEVCSKIVNRMQKYAFFMTVNGRPGMAKPGVRPGDRICVFSSAGVPYVLRPQRGRSRIVYRLMGPCFVHRIMDGEAILAAVNVLDTVDDHARVEDVFENVVLV